MMLVEWSHQTTASAEHIVFWLVISWLYNGMSKKADEWIVMLMRTTDISCQQQPFPIFVFERASCGAMAIRSRVSPSGVDGVWVVPIPVLQTTSQWSDFTVPRWIFLDIRKKSCRVLFVTLLSTMVPGPGFTKMSSLLVPPPWNVFFHLSKNWNFRSIIFRISFCCCCFIFLKTDLFLCS